MSLSTSNSPALSTCFRRSSRASSSSPKSVTGCFRKRKRRTTSGFGRTRLSMFCSSVREAVAAATAEEADAEAEEAEVAEAAAASEDVARRFWDLASNSRFSCSRSFWISFCWISERLKNLLPPVSWARDWRFLRSSCFRRSI
uniref:Uncharacterized protein n=1 Tax=Cajanus cajan TaxID=3821 RepID=A0A151TUG2_CAJCA|nr:hypothetical protein KK1_009920 [Cajanus cajan]